MMFSSNGELVYNGPAPDTITSYVISAFAINSDTGFGLMNEPVKV